MKLQKDYAVYITQDIVSTTPNADELEIKLSQEPVSDIGYVILDKGILNKEETVFYHRKQGASVFVYGINRINPAGHLTNASALLVSTIDVFNYLTENTFEQMFIYKVSQRDIYVVGGDFFIQGIIVSIPSVNTSLLAVNQTLVANATNYIAIKNGLYFISTTFDNTLYQVGTIVTDVSGNITSISRRKIFPISGKGLTEEQEQILNSINLDAEENVQANYAEVDPDSDAYIANKPDLNVFEVHSNKANSISENGETTKYPTTKAVRDELKLLVLKVPGKGLSTNDYTNEDKALVQGAVQSIPGKSLSTEDFSTELKDRLLEIVDYKGVEVIDGVNTIVTNTTTPEGKVIYSVSSLIGATNLIQYRSLSDLYTDDSDNAARKIINNLDSYFIFPENGYAKISGKNVIPDGATGIQKIRFFCNNTGPAGNMRIQLQLRIVRTDGTIQTKLFSVPFLISVGSGKTFFDIPSSFFSSLTFENVNDFYFVLHRDAQTKPSGVIDTVKKEIQITSATVYFQGQSEDISFGDKILFGESAPDVELGKNGFVYIDTLTWDLYSKADDVWTLEGNIQGAAGYTPVKGVDYFDGDDGYTPVKGTDYFDGYTPIKGTDYFDGKSVEIRTNATHIQWRLVGDATWLDLVSLASLEGYTPVKGVDYFDGDDGYTPIKGTDYFDGDQVEMQVSATHVQWKLEGEALWHDLVSLETIRGLPGKNVEMRSSGTMIQWRLVGDATWLDLYEIPSVAAVNWSDIIGKPTTFAPSAHNHDDIYHTKQQVIDLIDVEIISLIDTAPTDANTLNKLNTKIQAIQTLLSSDNINLDSVQEIVDALENIQSYLSDILVNDLTTGGTTKALTAQQGVVLKGLIDTLSTTVSDHNHDDRYYTETETDGLITGLLGGAPVDANTLKKLNDKVLAVQSLLASDNINLDTVQELVDALEDIQGYLATILVNNLTTGGTTKALTAEQGKVLNNLISALQTVVNGKMSLTGGNNITGDQSLVGNFSINGEVGGDTNFSFQKSHDTWWSKMRLKFIRSRGNLTSPTATVDGDVLGAMSWSGHNGTTFVDYGGIEVREARSKTSADILISALIRLGLGTNNPTESIDTTEKIRMRTQTVVGDSNDIVSTKGYTDKQKGSIFLNNFVLSTYKVIPFSDNGTAVATLAPTVDRLFYIPFILAGDTSITELSASISTVGTTPFRLGLYSNVSNRPNTVIVQSGDLATTTVANVTFSTSQTLLGGTVYWLAICAKSGTFRSVAVGGILNLLGFLSSSTTSATHYYEALTSGWTALPTTAGTLTTGTGAVPAIYIK